MLTKLTAHERLIPQMNITGDPALVAAARERRKAKNRKRAEQRRRAGQRVSVDVTVKAKKAVNVNVTVVVLHPKQEVELMENSTYWRGYRRRTCAGESPLGRNY